MPLSSPPYAGATRGTLGIATLPLLIVVAIFISSTTCGPGNAIITTFDVPRSTVEHSSRIIHATFYIESATPPELLETLRDHGLEVGVEFEHPSRVEVDLLAPGINIVGDLRQSEVFSFVPVQFDWGAEFKDPGTYALRVKYYLIGQSGGRAFLGSVEKVVSVTKPLGITQTLAWSAGVFVGLVAFIGGVLGIRAHFKKAPHENKATA